MRHGWDRVPVRGGLLVLGVVGLCILVCFGSSKVIKQRELAGDAQAAREKPCTPPSTPGGDGQGSAVTVRPRQVGVGPSQSQPASRVYLGHVAFANDGGIPRHATFELREPDLESPVVVHVQDGVFYAAVVNPRQCWIEAVLADGFSYGDTTFDVVLGEDGTLRVLLDRPASLLLRVKDALSGDPVAGALVYGPREYDERLSGWSQPSESGWPSSAFVGGAGGEVQTPEFTGEKAWLVGAEGYEWRVVPVRSAPDARPIDVPLRPGGHLTVMVVGWPEAQPASFTAAFDECPHWMSPDAAGRVALQGVPAGWVRIVVRGGMGRGGPVLGDEVFLVQPSVDTQGSLVLERRPTTTMTLAPRVICSPAWGVRSIEVRLRSFNDLRDVGQEVGPVSMMWPAGARHCDLPPLDTSPGLKLLTLTVPDVFTLRVFLDARADDPAPVVSIPDPAEVRVRVTSASGESVTGAVQVTWQVALPGSPTRASGGLETLCNPEGIVVRCIPGAVEFDVSADGYAAADATLPNLVPGSHAQLEVEVQRAGVLRVATFSGSGLMQGGVVWVGLQRESDGYEYGSREFIAGEFEWGELPPGSYSVRLDVDGYEACKLHGVTIRPESTTKIEAHLQPVSGESDK